MWFQFPDPSQKSGTPSGTMADPPPPSKLSKRCFPGLIVVNSSSFVPLHTNSRRVGEDRCPIVWQSWDGRLRLHRHQLLSWTLGWSQAQRALGKRGRSLLWIHQQHPQLCLSGDPAVGGCWGEQTGMLRKASSQPTLEPAPPPACSPVPGRPLRSNFPPVCPLPLCLP